MAEVLLKRLDKPTSRFLVYTSAGNHSQVWRWLKGRRNFDLWITSYTEDNQALRPLADFYHERKGGKFPNLHSVMQTWPELISNYEAIFVSDDDLHLSATDITELFLLREQYDLHVLQPAFNSLGKWSHAITRPCLFSTLRHTNFVEVTCPLFRFDKLEAFMKIYDPSLICHGVDYWFMQHLVGKETNRAAIVDTILALNPHDSAKGGREISRLQSEEDRINTWKTIKLSNDLSEIAPQLTYSKIRNIRSWRCTCPL